MPDNYLSLSGETCWMYTPFPQAFRVGLFMILVWLFFLFLFFLSSLSSLGDTKASLFELGVITVIHVQGFYFMFYDLWFSFHELLIHDVELSFPVVPSVARSVSEDHLKLPSDMCKYYCHPCPIYCSHLCFVIQRSWLQPSVSSDFNDKRGDL